MKQTNKEQPKKEKKTWKIVAITVIIIFALVVIGGVIKAYHFRSSFARPTQAQIDDAAKIATRQLQATGANLSSFQLHVGSHMKKFSDEGVARSIIDVSFANNSTMHSYLVDLNSGAVLLHSQTNFYGKWSNHKMYERHESMFPEKIRER